MIVEKGPPGLRRWFPTAAQVLADAGYARISLVDLVNWKEFTM
jgi:hypothetical protein